MSLLERLFLEYGADYQRTMRRFMGNEALYYRLLPKLFQDSSLKQLGEALESNNMQAAFEAAHTLKGVAANLGLTPLYEAVCEIVEPLRSEEQKADYPKMYQIIQQEFQRVEELWEQLEEGGNK